MSNVDEGTLYAKRKNVWRHAATILGAESFMLIRNGITVWEVATLGFANRL